MIRLALVFALIPAGFAQPRLQNAKIETRTVAGSGLDAAFRGMVAAQAEPAWIGYATPQVPGDHTMCCWNSWNANVACPGCTLEPATGAVTFPANPSGTVRLEGAPEFFVFFRVANRQVEKIRSFSMDCPIDAGGLPFIWLTGVDAAQSVALLESFLPVSDERTFRRFTGNALSAIALHRDGAPALIELARHNRVTEVRKQAVQWLGRSKDPRAEKFIEEVLATR